MLNLLNEGNWIENNWWIFAVIGALVIVVVVLIFLRKKKVQPSDPDADLKLIAENSKFVEVLLVQAEGNEEIVNELKELQEDLKYLKPSREKKVYDYDKKIKDNLGDLKIAFTKTDGEGSKKTVQLIKDIKMLVAERNTNV
ncbi:MAG: LPXTG cell wall anchor domain-containing protein [Clostridiales bacterium]|nr:LPXTG cell wall anchor domain-containing protein [Clostridiales bacterium]